MVAAGGRPLEPAKAFIVGVRSSAGLFSIFIYLHLIQSRQCMIYLHDPDEIPLERYHDTELIALQFVESMGFMVDNLNFRKLTPDQQQEFLNNAPFTYPDLNVYVQVTQSQELDSENGERPDLELAALEEDVIELADLVEEVEEHKQQITSMVSKEGLLKILRMLSSF